MAHRTFLFIVKKHAAVILIAMVLFSAAAYLLSMYVLPRRYQAEAMLIVKTVGAGSSPSITADDILTTGRLAETYAIIFSSTPVLDRVITELHLPTTEKRLEKTVFIAAEGNAGVLTLKVTGPSPQYAEKVAGAIIREAPRQIEASTDSGPVSVIAPPKADEHPVFPDKWLNAAMAGLLGLFVGLLYAAFQERPGKRFQSEFDVEEKLGLPLLGVVPKARPLRTARR